MKLNNIPIKVINENKFKNVMIRFCFLNDYNEENITAYALLSYILVSACRKYNTKKKRLDAISDIYNAEINFSTHSIYKTRASYFTMRLLNPKYTSDNNLLEKSLKIFYEFILNPYVDCDSIGNKSFNRKIFDEAKQFMLDDIKKEYEDKECYALQKVLINMFPNEIFSLNPLGKKEELEVITPRDVYLTYLDLINHSQKIIFAIGDCFTNLDEKLRCFKTLYNQDLILNRIYHRQKHIKAERTIEEKASIKQTILMLGYHTNTSVADKDYDALQIFVDMLGGHISSNLFQVVREKHSLCYSIESALLSSEQTIIIKAGIDKKNIHKTIDLIKQEIDKYKQGIIDKNLFKIIQKEYLDSLEENNDTFGGIFGIELDHYLFDIPNDIVVLQERIRNITSDDIIRVSKKIELDVIYLLSD